MKKHTKAIMTLLASIALTLGTVGSFSAASATTAGSTQVIPTNNVSITVNSKAISKGYKVGESIIFPVDGGYVTVDNPDVNWTLQAKKAYLNTHQSATDLATFRKSSYAALSDPQSVTPNKSSSVISPDTDIYVASHTFSGGTFFTVNGDSEGGEVGDDSTLITTGDEYNEPYEPYDYASWGPISTHVYDLQGNPTQLQLNLTWTFVGVGLGAYFPPGVSQNGNSGTWSGTQIGSTWYFDFTMNSGQYPSWATTLATQTSTSYTFGGTVYVPGNAYYSSHTEGFNGNYYGDGYN